MKILSRVELGHSTSYHDCSSEIKSQIREKLLKWYDVHQRQLPWRTPWTDAEELSSRSYRVWVSEIMLQQTQVATVIDYFNQWMSKWPTVEALSKSDLDQVHQVWSGLGYYSRATRLFEASKLVTEKFKGCLPSDPAVLEKEIPGVGPYTAGAIASIGFNKCAPLVDGNVVRVFSRLFAVGINMKSKKVSFYWDRARELVDEQRPGDFNQALMDLGATICTPANPSCDTCPLNQVCLARAEVEFIKESKKENLMQTKQESTCTLCDVIDIEEISVTKYPPKVEKKASRLQNVAVYVVYCPTTFKYLLKKGPEKGLLANLWDFPQKIVYDDFPEFKPMEYSTIKEYLQEVIPSDVKILERREGGSASHIFSHIHRTMQVEIVHVQDFEAPKEYQWVSMEDIQSKSVAVPVTMKKALALHNKKRPRSKQMTLDMFKK